MQLVRRFRLPALFCALAVLVCERISRPHAETGICDDGPYILVAQKLAATGHIVFNGWSAAMLTWQLYLGAALIKLFGFSFTTVRASTLLVAVILAFVLQRTLVRAGINERNATIGTLALVLSPLYLILSATFMSDVHGLFAIVLCLYGCLGALKSSNNRASIAWLCFAVATDAICGTSRQLAWLGILTMVPSTLWLLRARRSVFVAGAMAALAGVLFILGCLVWLKHQPYTTPESFYVGHIPVGYLVGQFGRFFLELPVLLLPLTALFLPQIRKGKPRATIIVLALILGYIVLAGYHSYRTDDSFSALLEPMMRNAPGCNWLEITGEYAIISQGLPPVFLPMFLQVVLACLSFGGIAGLLISFSRRRRQMGRAVEASGVSIKQLAFVIAPFAAAYVLLLIYRAASVANDGTGVLFDRYALGLLPIPLIYLVRYYQDEIGPRLPIAAIALTAIAATYGVVVTHNTFAFYRAKVSMAAELRDAQIPDTSVDNGWDFNVAVELRYSDHINNPFIKFPAHAYAPIPRPASQCSMGYPDEAPHVRPIYTISFDPNACYGPAPFAPVHYSRWLASQPGTLYVVHSLPVTR